MRSFLSLIFFATVFAAHAQWDTSDRNFQESKAILEQIKKDNNFRHGGLMVRGGFMTLASNIGDPLKLNSRNQMPFVNVEGDFELGRITRGLGWNFETTIGQNFLGGQKPTSANSTNSRIMFYQIGPRYRFILDESNIKNYFQFKFQYHGMSNNFKMTTQDSNAAFSYPKSHKAFLLGVERSIPVTSLYDFRAGLEFFYITNTESIPSLNVIEKKGRGILLKGEAFYNLKPNSRLGFMYSLSHFVNKFADNTSAQDSGKSSSTHTYRYLGATYSFLF